MSDDESLRVVCDDYADVDVQMVGGKVRCVPTSERALRWYFGTCPPELRKYFCYRGYGDTPFGWFEQRPGRGLDRRIALMPEARLRVTIDGSDMHLSEAAT